MITVSELYNLNGTDGWVTIVDNNTFEELWDEYYHTNKSADFQSIHDCEYANREVKLFECTRGGDMTFYV